MPRDTKEADWNLHIWHSRKHVIYELWQLLWSWLYSSHTHRYPSLHPHIPSQHCTNSLSVIIYILTDDSSAVFYFRFILYTVAVSYNPVSFPQQQQSWKIIFQCCYIKRFKKSQKFGILLGKRKHVPWSIYLSKKFYTHDKGEQVILMK